MNELLLWIKGDGDKNCRKEKNGNWTEMEVCHLTVHTGKTEERRYAKVRKDG